MVRSSPQQSEYLPTDTVLGAPGTWEHLIRQSGMFGFLGLSPAVVQKLKGEYTFEVSLPVGNSNLFLRRQVSHLYGEQLSGFHCWT